MAQTVADLDFDPIALLEQELGSNDRSARLRALLGDFSALLGGDQHGALLFDLLQSLARIEETMVRAKAVASLSPARVRGVRLRGARRSSALRRRRGVKKELRDVYARICADDAPIVRRAAAHELAAMCEAVAGAEAFDGDLSDGDEAHRRRARRGAPHRRGAAGACSERALRGGGGQVGVGRAPRTTRGARATATTRSAEEPWYAYEPGVHVVATAHVDASWRVRESLAKSFAGYVAYARRSVPDDGVGGCSKLDLGLGLLSMFAALFDDAEVEAAGRGADAPELKRRRGSSSRRRTTTGGSAALNGALPAVALARGKDAFEAQLLEGFVRSFQDRISEVRTSAVAVLGELRALKKPDGATGLPTDEALFDGDWLMEKIGKRLSELYLTMSYYLYRITIVAAFERLAHDDVAAEHMETIVLFLVDGARDDVPNVRFTAVKALETVSLHANDRLVANFIKPVLNELLANDTDADVRNYVKGAIAAL
ncbi:hypothetical protein JL720_12970 [Aureococcus anophagefferens]|nr:hypothetical protein JL720_12970 [Aureococcus anophagefferens]